MSISPYKLHALDFMNLDTFPSCDWGRYCQNVRVASLGSAAPPSPTAAFTGAHVGSAAAFTDTLTGYSVAIPAERGTAVVQDIMYDPAYDMVGYRPRMLTGAVPVVGMTSEDGPDAGWEAGDITIGACGPKIGMCGEGNLVCFDALQNVMDTANGVSPASLFPDAECDYGGVIFGIASNAAGASNYGVRNISENAADGLITIFYAAPLATPPVVSVMSCTAGVTLIVQEVTAERCTLAAVSTVSRSRTATTSGVEFCMLYCGATEL